MKMKSQLKAIRHMPLYPIVPVVPLVAFATLIGFTISNHLRLRRLEDALHDEAEGNMSSESVETV